MMNKKYVWNILICLVVIVLLVTLLLYKYYKPTKIESFENARAFVKDAKNKLDEMLKNEVKNKDYELTRSGMYTVKKYLEQANIKQKTSRSLKKKQVQARHIDLSIRIVDGIYDLVNLTISNIENRYRERSTYYGGAKKEIRFISNELKALLQQINRRRNY